LTSCRDEFLTDVRSRPFLALFDSYEKLFLYTLTYFSIFVGCLVFFTAFLAIPFALIYALKGNKLLIIVSAAIFIYQFLVNALAFQMKLYSSFSYFFGLVIIVFVFDCFYKRRKS
jgi:hypothetical protein